MLTKRRSLPGQLEAVDRGVIRYDRMFLAYYVFFCHTKSTEPRQEGRKELCLG